MRWRRSAPRSPRRSCSCCGSWRPSRWWRSTATRAGLGAAQRLIDLALPLLGPGRALRFALLPAGQDPDDVVRAGGAAAMRGAARRVAADRRADLGRETAGRCSTAPSAAPRSTRGCRAHLARIGDPGLRAHWEARDPHPARRAVRAAAARGRPRHAARPAAAEPRARPGALPAAATRGGTRASLLVAAGDRSERRGADPRERHPRRLPQPSRRSALALEERLERMAFRCRDLGGDPRRPLVGAAERCMSRGDLRAARRGAARPRSAAGAGRPGQVRANPHLRAGAEPGTGARARSRRS